MTARSTLSPPRALGLALILLAVAFPGCGSAGSGAGDRPQLRVSAGASLQRAFTRYARDFPAADARLSFAGSDALAAQIQRGVRPDVFASANADLPQRLFRQGLVARPVIFAANRLVVAVPAGAAKVRSVGDLARPGVTIALGSSSVPIGSYTRRVLARLTRSQAAGIAANVRSREPDVAGIVAKVSQGAVDAGFVYVTDVAASGGRLRAIALPASSQPDVAYAAAVVRGSRHGRAARDFVAGLRRGAGQHDLRQAGFLPPPA